MPGAGLTFLLPLKKACCGGAAVEVGTATLAPGAAGAPMKAPVSVTMMNAGAVKDIPIKFMHRALATRQAERGTVESILQGLTGCAKGGV